MALVINFEFVDHGFEHPDFFQGCGVALTKYDLCFTGHGDTPCAAAHEALELASHEHRWNDVTFEEAEAEAELFSNMPASDSAESDEERGDACFMVSIRIKFIT